MNNQSNKPNLPAIEEIVKDIEQVLEETGLEPSQLTVAKYAANGGKYDGRRLRRLGGFKAIVEEAFGEAAKDVDIITAHYLKRRKQHVSKLERTVADQSYWHNSLLTSFEALLKKYPVQVSNLKKAAPTKAETGPRAIGALVSDIHLGLKIDPEEVMHNAYDWAIGARRLGKFTDQIATYKIEHRDECDTLHLCLGGDLGQGIIHLSDANTDLITHQVHGISIYMIQMIDYLRQFFKRIVVHCTPDNHMRLTHKGPDRAKAQKHDAYSTMIHLEIQMAFRTTQDVIFDIPKHAITRFHVLGHKFALTHGDGHISSGNVGSSINVKSITNQVLRLNASEDEKFDAVLMGHVHSAVYAHLNETGTDLIINGTGSGTDPYAEGLGYFRTKACQVMWETTEDFAVGDFRRVDLDDASQDRKYEKIIVPYTGGLDIKPYFNK